MKPIQGNTAACLVHLQRSIPEDKFAAARETIARFVGVQPDAVYRWYQNDNLPKGEALVRLRFYLEFLGYQVDELSNLQDAILKIGRVYSFGVVSLAELLNVLGLEENDNNRGRILKVLRGVIGASADCVATFTSLAQKNEQALRGQQMVTRKVITFDTNASASQAPVKNISSGNQDAVVNSFAGMIKAMLPLAEYVLSDSFTAEQRALIRHIASDGKDISRLSQLMTQLSNEAARAALKQQ